MLPCSPFRQPLDPLKRLASAVGLEECTPVLELVARHSREPLNALLTGGDGLGWLDLVECYPGCESIRIIRVCSEAIAVCDFSGRSCRLRGVSTWISLALGLLLHRDCWLLL